MTSETRSLLIFEDPRRMIIPNKKATRELTKLHNRRLVFTTIYNHKEISRAEIARVTDLTATTVSNAVTDLIADGLVEEEASVRSTKGKPPTLLRVNKDAHHMICLDLTRSAFQGAIINLRGEILDRMSIPIQGRTGQAALDVAYELVDALLPAVPDSILGVGVGAPGIIDPGQGIVHRAVNFGWYDLPLRDLLVERYKLSTYIANASHAAVLAEYMFGRRKNTSDLVVVKVGHEVGAGIILNGQLFLGHGFGAGEIGHVTVVENGERCSCGNFGCLETVCSSRAVVKRAQSIARDTPESLLNRFSKTPEELDIDAVLRAFEAGDVALQSLVADVGHCLGVAIANLVGVLSVPFVLIAGSIGAFGEPLLNVINQEVQNRSLARMVSQTRVELASLGPDIVLLGAAALLVHYDLEVL
jgi:predicted NBD/HSP70 family sugar kinase